VEPSPAEPAKEEPAKEDEGASLVQKLPTFRDIDDIDLTTLLKVTAGEEGSRTVDDEPGLVTVISEEDIRRTGAGSLREVLQTVSGLEVLTDGVGRARIVVRGVPAGVATGSSENVLVTLNGMRLNDSIFGGTTAVNLDLPVDNIKRIEIVRGRGIGPRRAGLGARRHQHRHGGHRHLPARRADPGRGLLQVLPLQLPLRDHVPRSQRRRLPAVPVHGRAGAGRPLGRPDCSRHRVRPARHRPASLAPAKRTTTARPSTPTSPWPTGISASSCA
jgi:hypothetical protein